MNRWTKYIVSLFLRPRFFWAIGWCVVMFIIAFYLPFMSHFAYVLVALFFFLTIIDYIIIYHNNAPLLCSRLMSDKWGNGDEEQIVLQLESKSNWPISFEIIDEIPAQFQERDFSIIGLLPSFNKKNVAYNLSPKSRGVYTFGNIFIFIYSPIGFVERKLEYHAATDVKVYPSFMRLKGKKIKGGAFNNEVGDNKVAKLSNSLEFDHIKDYVNGDDIRSINWKASARRGQLMVNTFNDERSQQVYLILDMGRNMGLAFDGMRLNDYAINASLMLSHTILLKKDKVGIITFENKIKDVLSASRKSNQLTKITEVLYKQESLFLDPNYEVLVSHIHYQVGQRSLIILFANFETVSSLERNLIYLKAISKKHVLCIVVFENEGIKTIHSQYKNTLEGVYIKTIADKFSLEKKRIIKEMNKHGILSIFTTPEKLTSDSINKYLELKTKRII
jgi:uncharacterized protein (DUF58 family)